MPMKSTKGGKVEPGVAGAGLPDLSLIPLFEGLPSENYADLRRILVAETFMRGEVIFSDGDEGRGFYVVHTGRIKIFKLSPDGKEQILHILGPGEPFGEAVVFAGQSFPAHAQAMTKSGVFFFPRLAFVDLIRKNPALALNMLGSLSRRLRKFALLIEDLSLKEVPGRLAAYLLYLSDSAQQAPVVRLEIPKSQLASLLGTIPETLSRILAKMNKQGFVSSRGAMIQILDRHGLSELAAADRRL